ncbi:hypothetical protein COB21_00340 [Candidatus Aerophobetes bacterium]|uniref:DOT1 domain-containing protein n=1 Tax=Aerophobetes bacterium TaxID=2030807 RepID=A0A2A4X834_UNCAE|nr:MAG: hypothetical protein COB21_00340 [Candidatus Aerophobetes bacterium]
MIAYLISRIKDVYLAQVERRAYYANAPFAQVDILLNRAYKFKSPFRISSAFLRKKGFLDIHLYGETPLHTLDKLAQAAHITSSDCVLDLGAGRGRSLLFWHSFYGCKVIGYEQIPLFCARANSIFSKNKLPLEMKNQTLEQGLGEEGSIAYLYGPNFSASQLKALVTQIIRSKSLKKVISISFPLSDYDKSGHLSPFRQIEVNFPWGKTTAYIETVTSGRAKTKTPRPSIK